MAVKFGSDGTLYCNTIKYNYKVARNLIPNGCLCSGDASGLVLQNADVSSVTGDSGSRYAVKFGYMNDSQVRCTSMPTPIAGHKYYGACLYFHQSGNTISDGRFEWQLNDSMSLRFGWKTADTNSKWVRLSSIQSLDTVTSGSWYMRNFVVNASKACYTTKMMIVDLTDTFGAGNEPTKEWCDECILEWGMVYYPPEIPITSSNYNSAYTSSYTNCYDYNYADNEYFPRDYYIQINGNTSLAEVTMTSSSTISLDNTYRYYGFADVQYPEFSTYYNKSMDIYCPVAEPLLGQTTLVNPESYNGGGNCKYWKRVSMFNNRSSFESGSYNCRYDLNNSYTDVYVRMTNICLYKITRFTYFSSYFTDTSIGGFNIPSSYSSSIITKPFLDRRFGGQNPSIIHIPDPNNKTIKFNTNYDIVCNDILPDANETSVWFDNYGRIHCKTIVTDQNY